MVVNDLSFAGCIAGLDTVRRDVPDSLTLNDGRDRARSDLPTAVIMVRKPCVAAPVR